MIKSTTTTKCMNCQCVLDMYRRDLIRKFDKCSQCSVLGSRHIDYVVNFHLSHRIVYPTNYSENTKVHDFVDFY